MAFVTKISMSQQFPPKGLVWRRWAMDLTSSLMSDGEGSCISPPLRHIVPDSVCVMCPFLIGCGDCEIEAFLN